MPNKDINKSVVLTIGFVLLVSGLVLILSWWPQIVLVFQGLSGIVLALAGLMVLYTVKG